MIESALFIRCRHWRCRSRTPRLPSRPEPSIGLGGSTSVPGPTYTTSTTSTPYGRASPIDRTIRRAVTGYARLRGTGTRQARALMLDHLRRIIAGIPTILNQKHNHPRVIRDRTLLTLGWATGLSCSGTESGAKAQRHHSDQGKRAVFSDRCASAFAGWTALNDQGRDLSTRGFAGTVRLAAVFCSATAQTR